MRVGLVGLGSIGRRHLGNLLALGCDVVAMDVSSEARAAAKSQYPTARIVDAVPFNGLDALVIATPAGNHLPWVEDAIRRRLPFFVEKPLGTLEQLPRWRELAALDLPVNQVGYNWLWNDEVESAWPDRLQFVHLICDTRIADWPGSYADPILECSHELAVMAVRYPHVPTSAVGRLGQHGFYAQTPLSLVDVRWNHEPMRRFVFASLTGVRVLTPSQASIDASYVSEMMHFLSAVRANSKTLCPLSTGLQVLNLCAAIDRELAA